MKKFGDIGSYFKFVSRTLSDCKGLPLSRKQRKQIALTLQKWDAVQEGISPDHPPLYFWSARINLKGVTTGRVSAC